MVSEWMEKPELRGPMCGLIAGFNCLAEQLITSKVLDGAALAGLFEQMIEGWRQQTADPALWDAANVLDQLRRPLVDQDRAATRKLLRDEPKGQA
jgi:hypothetical protein